MAGKKTAQPDCNDAIAAYTTTFEIPYGREGAPGSPHECEPPSFAEEGAALDTAKNNFKAVAAAYCDKGQCPVASQQCLATVEILAVENLGMSTKTAEGSQRCRLKFKVTGSITCRCRKP
jgi:hypothetical protein